MTGDIFKPVSPGRPDGDDQHRFCVVLSQAKYLALAGDPASARRILDVVGRDKDYNATLEFDLKLVHESLSRAGA